MGRIRKTGGTSPTQKPAGSCLLKDMQVTSPYLVMKSISKRFPGVQALDRVDLEAERGEVHAIIGENGAGKSTLVKILGGALRPDDGEMTIGGTTVQFASARDAEKAGVAIIYQELNLCPHLSVAENITLGREPRNRWGLVDRKKMTAEAESALRKLGARIDVSFPVQSLKVGEQQIVEIAKALSLRTSILIMDEPTSALSLAETDRLFQVIRSLKESGVTILYISHKLDEIFRIADKATVLRDGRRIGTRNIQGTSPSEFIVMMVGREMKEISPKAGIGNGPVLLEVKGLTVHHPSARGRPLLEAIDLELKGGEILGLAGLMGAGRSELLMSLFGHPPGDRSSGEIRVRGKAMRIASPAEAIRNGMALVTEDRAALGLFLPLSVRTNMSISSLRELSHLGLIRSSREKARVRGFIERFGIKVPGQLFPVMTLSGGNQQKVILSRWLLTRPEILLLDEPTRGIDIGAKAEIYRLMHEFVAEGMGILLATSELQEIMELSDRILVLNQGRITGRFDERPFSEHRIMEAAMRNAS